MPTQQSLDPSIMALTKAIGRQEGATRPNSYDFSKIGPDGERGAYQMTPGFIATNAPVYLKDQKYDPKNLTPAQQDELAYKVVEARGKAGLAPAEIAAEWNSGHRDAWKGSYAGTSPGGAHYDTPQYVKNVSQYYQEYLQQNPSQAAPAGQQGGYPTTPLEAPAGMPTNAPTQNGLPQNSFIGDIGNTIAQTGTGIGNVVQNTMSGQINPLSGILQGVGAAAGGISSGVNDIATHLPVVGGVVKGAENLIGQGVGAAANTAPGQAVVGLAQNFAKAHPEAAGNIGAAFNIASLIPVLKGLGLAKGAVKGAVGTALRGSTDAALETVAPKLTAREAAQAVMQRGTVQKGLLRETKIAPNPADVEVKNAVVKNVPGFSASKPLTENIAATRTAVGVLKKSLQSDVADESFPERKVDRTRSRARASTRMHQLRRQDEDSREER